MPKDRRMNLENFLLHFPLFTNNRTEPEGNKIKRGMHWILNNQSKVCLVLDGLDQAPFQISNNPSPNSSMQEELLPRDLIGLLMARRFLPGIRLIITSRPHSILAFDKMIQPDITLFVNNLLTNDMVTLMNHYIPHQDAKQILDKVGRKSNRILQLLTTPLFLQLFSMLYCEKGEDIWPYVNTASKLMKTVIKGHQDSAHLGYEEEDIAEVQKRIGRMAYEKTMLNEIVFAHSDLLRHNLTAQQVQDMCFVVPQNLVERIKSSLENLLVWYFHHQSIQVS